MARGTTKIKASYLGRAGNFFRMWSLACQSLRMESILKERKALKSRPAVRWGFDCDGCCILVVVRGRCDVLNQAAILLRRGTEIRSSWSQSSIAWPEEVSGLQCKSGGRFSWL